MAIYNTNSVTVKVGSSEVIGNNTDFNTYVTAGYLFKIVNDSTWYEVAGINTATNLTLSTRYTNTNYRTARAENVASITTATQMYSDTLSYTPVIQNYVVVNASIEKFSDNGAGVLTGDGSPAGSGTVDYDTGAFSITLGTSLTASANMTASYLSGDTRVALTYQIVRDYTTHYDLPEMGVNDSYLPYIYTRAMRSIDSNLRDLVNLTVTASRDITVNATPYGFVMYSDDGSKFRLKVSNTATLTASLIS